MTYHVYRYWRGKEALYVGCTAQIEKRLMTHRLYPHGFECDRIDAVEVGDRDTALAVEKSEITRLKPVYNEQHNPRNGGRPAPQVKTPQSFYNWKKKGFEGFYPAEPIEEDDDT
jgi:predicted GIY-YIG superfamily endonuclease